MKKHYKLIDLFAGAGGMSLGFTDDRFGGGFESVFALDNDKAAVETYNANFKPKHAVHANIEDWLAQNSVPSCDVVIGGPPCQGFSLLNKNRCGDVRRALWEPYIDIVTASGASLFVMENVTGLLKSDEFRQIRERAENLGFHFLNPSVLNTADYGVPQTRKRTIAIAYKVRDFPSLEHLPKFPPAPTHKAKGTSGDLPDWRVVSEVIDDLPKPVGTEIRRDAKPPLDLHFGRNPTAMSLERYKAIPKGGNRFDLHANRPDIMPQCWIRKKTGGTDLFGRLWADRPSVTIRTEFFKPEKGRYLHPMQHRPITHREAARLMTFPDGFAFKGTKIEIARQIGNAVPPVFAGKLAVFVTNLLSLRIEKNQKVA